MQIFYFSIWETAQLYKFLPKELFLKSLKVLLE